MKCPKCGNNYCTLSASVQTKGKDYSIGKGLLGAAVFGADGAALGWTGKRKTSVAAYWKCKRCGHTFAAG